MDTPHDYHNDVGDDGIDIVYHGDVRFIYLSKFYSEDVKKII